MPTHGSLFTGIGGLDLGLERAGFTTRWQVESDPFCRRVLARHWPDIPRHGDIHDLDPATLEEVDLISGGFPCQPVSCAGKRQAQADPRWLWPQFERVLSHIRPRLVLVENVPGLLTAGGADVLAGLASLGYDAEWDCVPAAAVGAPHIRHRVFILGYRDCSSQNPLPTPCASWDAARQPGGRPDAVARVADADRPRLEVGACFGGDAREELAAIERDCSTGEGIWATEPDVGRVAHGVPGRVDRLRALGNAVVPQVAEYVGRRLMRLLDD